MLLFLLALLARIPNPNDEFEGEEDLTGYMSELIFKINHGWKFTLKQEIDLEKLNILVLGKTGVGKSTLINHIFRFLFAETGVGRSITKVIQKFTKENCPFNIYDVPGFELNNKKQLLKDIFKLINDMLETNDPSNYIHCIWYCISSTSKRIEKSEIDIIKQLSKKTNTPIIIVVTQCYNDKDRLEMLQAIAKERLNVDGIVDVLAKKKTIINIKQKQRTTYHPYGLYNLIQVMDYNLPLILHTTAYNVHTFSLTPKRLLSKTSIYLSTALAAGIGGKWIPYTNRYMLIPTNLIMMSSINYIYGVNFSKDFMNNCMKKTIGEIEKIYYTLKPIKKTIEPLEIEDDDENDDDYIIDENNDNNIEMESDDFQMNDSDGDHLVDNSEINDEDINDFMGRYLKFMSKNLKYGLSIPFIGGIISPLSKVPHKIIKFAFPKMANIYSICYQNVKESIPVLFKLFKENKTNTVIAISSSAATYSLGESYRKLVEHYYISNRTYSEDEIYDYFKSLFKNQYTQEISFVNEK